MKSRINILITLLLTVCTLLSSCKSRLTEAEMARIRAEVDAEWAAKYPSKPVKTAPQPIAPPVDTRQVKEKQVRNQLVKEAQSWVGVPYKLGGNTRKGIDCSGLVVQIYKNVYGKMLHRTSQEQYQLDIAQYVGGNQLKPGYLVFFSTTRGKGRVNHVGVYLDDYKFVHAGNHGVVIEDLREGYWVKNWMAGGKVK